MKLWGLSKFFEERRRKKAFDNSVASLSKALSVLQEGETAVASFEGTQVKFIRKGDWFDAFVSRAGAEWEPLAFNKPKPEVQHYNIDGIPVTVGMDSNEWVEAMLDTYPMKNKKPQSDPWPY
jgi:hypothetical protein